MRNLNAFARGTAVPHAPMYESNVPAKRAINLVGRRSSSIIKQLVGVTDWVVS